MLSSNILPAHESSYTSNIEMIYFEAKSIDNRDRKSVV